MRTRLAVRLAAVAAAGLGLAGCGSAGSSRAQHGDPAATTTGGRAERVTVSADACAPGWSAAHGGRYDFTLAARGSQALSVSLEQAVSGVVVERRQVSPGSSATLSATLQTGNEYRFACAAGQGTPHYSAAVQVAADTATVAAAAASSPAPPAVVDLIGPLSSYTRHEDGLLRTLRARIDQLQAQLAAGSLDGARTAWLAAHIGWLELGQDDLAYGAFGALGGKIDGQAAGLPGGTRSPKFTGFHKVELDLWRRHDLAAARHDSSVLAGLVAQLTPKTVSGDLPATVTGLDNWVLRGHEILEDALRDSLTGDDDYGSDSDLVSVRADVTATREMLQLLGPLIRPRRPGLVATATRRLRALDAAIAAAGNGGRPLSRLRRRLRQRVDAMTGAALQTLAPVSELMQVGNS